MSLTFSTLEITGSEWNKAVQLNGATWSCRSWDSEMFRSLDKVVPAGEASISERKGDGGGYYVKIRLPGTERCIIEYGQVCEDLPSAVAFAEAFAWDIAEHAGIRWYRTSVSGWAAYLGEGDMAKIGQYTASDPYHISREISPRLGEIYKMEVVRYNSGDVKQAVTEFQEAAAIALTLPAYLSILGSKPNIQTEDGRPD